MGVIGFYGVALGRQCTEVAEKTDQQRSNGDQTEKTKTMSSGSCTLQRSAVPPQPRLEFLERAGIQHVLRLQPRAPGDEHAPARPAERGGRMRVARDDDRNAALTRQARMDLVEIQPVQLTVDLDG